MATPYDLQSTAKVLQAAGSDIYQLIHDNLSMDYHLVVEMSNKAQDLLIKSKALFTLSAIQIADDAKSALDNLSAAQNDISKVLKNIALVHTSIDIAVKLVGLAGAIASGNPGKIISSSQDVITEVAGALG